MKGTVKAIERFNLERDERCGTPTGYSRHQGRGENPCDSCARAKQEYDHRWRLSSDVTKRNRLQARAQNKAYQTLAWKYSDEYRELYLAYKAELYAEHGMDATP